MGDTGSVMCLTAWDEERLRSKRKYWTHLPVDEKYRYKLIYLAIYVNKEDKTVNLKDWTKGSQSNWLDNGYMDFGLVVRSQMNGLINDNNCNILVLNY